MIDVDNMINSNEVLKKFNRIVGSRGDSDYFRIGALGPMFIGLKFAIENSYQGTFIISRIRFVSSGAVDIFNVESHMESNFKKQKGQAEKLGMQSLGNERVSYCIHAEKSLNSLGNDMKANGTEILNGFKTQWGQVQHKVGRILGIFTEQGKEIMDNSQAVSDALMEIYSPKLPNTVKKGKKASTKSTATVTSITKNADNKPAKKKPTTKKK